MKLSVPMLFGPGDGNHFPIDTQGVTVARIRVPKPMKMIGECGLDEALEMPEVVDYVVTRAGIRGQDGSTVELVALIPADRFGELTAWETLRVMREGVVWPLP